MKKRDIKRESACYKRMREALRTLFELLGRKMLK